MQLVMPSESWATKPWYCGKLHPLIAINREQGDAENPKPTFAQQVSCRETAEEIASAASAAFPQLTSIC